MQRTPHLRFLSLGTSLLEHLDLKLEGKLRCKDLSALSLGDRGPNLNQKVIKMLDTFGKIVLEKSGRALSKKPQVINEKGMIDPRPAKYPSVQPPLQGHPQAHRPEDGPRNDGGPNDGDCIRVHGSPHH